MESVTKNKLIVLFFIALANIASAQGKLQGNVLFTAINTEEKKLPAVGAVIKTLDGKNKAICNPEGDFTITANERIQKITISLIGFETDTVTIKNQEDILNIVLVTRKKSKLNEVNIIGFKPATEISFIKPNQVYQITKKELKKAACCNLSESFETTPSVDVSYTDAITGQKQIQLLGLATPNTLITTENVATIRGLGATIGLNYTPGTWVQSMQLSKGVGSVINGYEGIAGQINVELIKPDNAPKVIANAYHNTGGRAEANLITNKKWNKNLSSGIMLHYKNQWLKQDMQHDGYMDNPLGTQKIGLFRTAYFNEKGIEIQGGIKYINANLNGGQIKDTLFLFNTKNDKAEAWVKIGKVFPKKPWKSMGMQIAFIGDEQKAQSNKIYKASQQSLYANYILQGVVKNTNHNYKLGASFIKDNVHENLNNNLLLNYSIKRNEQTVGTFVEHTYSYLDKLTLVTGIRADYSNLYKLFFTPRLHMRYAPNASYVIRASMGRAQRTVNTLSENQNILFTQRNLVLQGNSAYWSSGAQQEVAWNFGTSITKNYELNYRKGSLVVDYYYTTFAKSIISDYETAEQLQIYALANNNKTNSVQIQNDYNIIRKKLDLRIAYRYLFTNIAYKEKTAKLKPLQSVHRAFVNLAYLWKKKWDADVTIVWNGKKRIANSASNHTAAAHFPKGWSPNFFTINTQISRTIAKQYNFYIGIENLTNYKQPHPINYGEQPLNAYFDATQVWGPIMGANGYVGFNYELK